MKNKEKAKDMTRCLWYPQKCTEDDIQNMLIEMAEWKDEQFQEEKKKWLDKACEWIEPVFKNLAGYNCGGDLINDFKKAMEE